MWCRALLLALAVTYLVCVLILSGVKHEDLDVNTLIKLQRHNVNLDDMNNETLRKDCASAARIDTTSSTAMTEPTTLTTEVENQTVKNFGPSFQLLQTLRENFKLADLNSILTKYTVLKNTPNYKTELNQEKNPKHLINSGEIEPFTTASTTSELVHNENIVQSNGNYNNLKQILSFWDRFKTTRGVEETTKNFQVTSYIKQTSIINNNYNFIPMNIQTDQITTTPYIMPADVVKVYEDCLSKQQNENSPEIPSSSINKPETMPDESSNLIRTIINKMQVDENDMTNKRTNVDFLKNMIVKKDLPLEENLTLLQTQNINKLLEQYKELKRDSSTIIKLTKDLKKQITNLPKTKPLFYSKPVDLPTEKRQQSNEIEQVTIPKNSKNQVYTKPAILQSDIIKEIAANIKALVLNDIKKEILPTTIRTTVSTDITTITESSQMIQKLIDMLLQIKDSKISTNVNVSQTNKNIQSLATESNTIKTYVMPFYMPFAYPPREATSTKQVNKSFNYKFTNTNKKKPINRTIPSIQAPIIQTNSDEIPPLAISIRKPLKIIGQTILVTTSYPTTVKTNRKFVKTLLHNQRGRHHLDYTRDRHRDTDSPTRFNLNHSFKLNSEHISRGKPTEEYIAFHRSTYNNDGDNRQKFHKSIPKFHEKLERVDNSQYNSWESKRQEKKYIQSYKVESRQQMPLNSLKASSYDDSHFRNFIKTQQKVNSMLERILATKVLSDDARDGARVIYHDRVKSF